jgi:hypothetical protein
MTQSSKPRETRQPSESADPKPANSGELSKADLDRVAGGTTKHPAKVTVPDIKLG